LRRSAGGHGFNAYGGLVGLIAEASPT